MQDLIIPVNNEAHSRALIAVVGEEQAQVILKAYQTIDAAMVFGYAKSQAEEADKRKVLTEQYVEALQRSEDRDDGVAFKAGFDAGCAETLQNLKELTAEEAEVHFEAGQISGRDTGYASGYSQGFDVGYQHNEEDLQDAFDDGYLDGVHDARVNPTEADDYIEYLLDQDEAETYETTDDFANAIQRDSGDENDALTFPNHAVIDTEPRNFGS